jgi:uncharacterized protein with FMN-binding domain
MSIPKKPFPGSHLILSFGMILISAVYARWQYVNKPPTISPTEQFKNANDAFLEALSRAADMPPSAKPGSPMMGGPMMRSGQYVDGSYTGSATDAYYGTVQVKATVQGGRLADVQFLQHPGSQENSIFINGRAMPLLVQEAIQIQDAQVDGVSGATFTSEAFRQSLASALVQAK